MISRMRHVFQGRYKAVVVIGNGLPSMQTLVIFS